MWSMSPPTEPLHSTTMPVVMLTNQIIRDALGCGASEFLLESGPNFGLVNFRVDGALSEHMRVAADTMPKVLRRVGVLSGVDLIFEWLEPQDGSTRIVFEGKAYELEVTYVPSGTRDQASMRVLIIEAPE
jgi:type II secretory ATPase GspE/PulE/Tfp pilus assembly ATPase PilB-like protein